MSRWAIETMGPHRCLFESNFPLDRRVFSYTRLWNGFKRMIGGGSPSEKRALLYENATRFYDIDETIVTSP